MSSAFPILQWWSWECVLYLIIIINPEVSIINHCLGLGHETMVCAVCLTMFLWHNPLSYSYRITANIKWVMNMSLELCIRIYTCIYLELLRMHLCLIFAKTRFQFHSSLFLRVHLTVSRQWFIWLNTTYATRRYMMMPWVTDAYMRHPASVS